MALKVIPLQNLLNSVENEGEVIPLLSSFETLKISSVDGTEDVETFLHNKAIQFEKMGLSRTYLVMSTYRDEPFLAGYFSISNRSLVMSKKNFMKLSASLKKRLMGVGHKTVQDTYEIKGFLIGQLGKNYSDISKQVNALSGSDLLALTYEKIKTAHQIVGGRILYLECENHQKLKEFYISNGFNELEGYESPNKLCMMVKRLDLI